jgi:tetratricopeptide (TPR) repeat protein
LYISVSTLLAAPGRAAQNSNDEAERLYADRTNLVSARRAAEVWAAELAHNPQSYDAAWKLARASYWLGGHAPQSERRKFLEQGIEAGRKAVAIEPNLPAGHFWIAANMGSLAESFGMRQGLKYRKPIKEELETVLRLEPGFQSGSAQRALGRWYFKVPGFFGGSNKRAEEYLRRSLEYDDSNTVSHYFLAEVLIDEERYDEARVELQKVIDAPPNPEWEPENQDYKARARQRLAAIK